VQQFGQKAEDELNASGVPALEKVSGQIMSKCEQMTEREPTENSPMVQ
jgi:hypothetical protein